MKNKELDIPYCGCNADRIKNARPEINMENFKHLYTWIIERYRVHLLKDVYKKPAPWTENPIIREYRFTNVRREHDKETRWVLENVCKNTALSLQNRFMNIVLFRMINKSETCKQFMPLDFDNIDYAKINAIVDSFSQEYKPFTNAFMVSGMLRLCREQVKTTSSNVVICVEYCQKLFKEGFADWAMATARTAQEFYENFRAVEGIGYFLAYQMYVDFTYCPESPWSENEFVVAGPGARRGLDHIFDNKDHMTHEECLFWLRDNWESICDWCGLPWNPDEIFMDLPKADRYMNVMSLQNCHCEISKYLKVVYGTGQPRNKYRYHDMEE